MKFSIKTIAILFLISMPFANSAQDSGVADIAGLWTDSFDLRECNFSTTGQNTYFVLQAGYQLTLKGADDGDSVSLLITVLNDIVEIDGIITRVVEERESVNGELVEVSRNFFAFCQDYSSIFYFGEDVDIYKDGQVVSHDGAWRAGENGNRAGLMMPGQVLLGASYYQEIAPKIAMDRARIIATDGTLETPMGKFQNCLVTEETTPLEPNAKEEKIYAPIIGLIKDGSLVLVKSGYLAFDN